MPESKQMTIDERFDELMSNICAELTKSRATLVLKRETDDRGTMPRICTQYLMTHRTGPCSSCA